MNRKGPLENVPIVPRDSLAKEVYFLPEIEQIYRCCEKKVLKFVGVIPIVTIRGKIRL